MTSSPRALVTSVDRADRAADRLAETCAVVIERYFAADVCARCAEGARCYGVRRGYAELYGTAELRPFPHAGGGS